MGGGVEEKKVEREGWEGESENEEEKSVTNGNSSKFSFRQLGLHFCSNFKSFAPPKLSNIVSCCDAVQEIRQN